MKILFYIGFVFSLSSFVKASQLDPEIIQEWIQYKASNPLAKPINFINKP